MSGKKGFLMYSSWTDGILALTDESAGKLLKALMAYNRDGKPPDRDALGEASFVTFSLFRVQIDENNEKYMKTCEARSAAGAAGGKQTQANASKRQAKPSKTKQKPPDNDNDNDKDNDKDNDLSLRIDIKGAGREADFAPAAKLMLNDSSFYEVTQRQIEHWKELYPAVEIVSELRKMSGWLEANPQKRKTRNGILRFVTNWLAREQDRGRSVAAQPVKKTAASYDLDEYERETRRVPKLD